MALQVGDRVERQSMHGDEPRVGIVTDVYKSSKTSAGQQDTLYEVEWGDTRQRERGYLAVGLKKMD